MYKFGPFPITPSQIFFTSKHSFGLVNLKPVVKGHVLIIPRKNVAKFCDLDEIQISDLFKSTHIISSVLQKLHKAGSLTITIQDGPDAGQTVPHVHVHVSINNN
jgi:bis(5'-adenosyl)-triphosphatase